MRVACFLYATLFNVRHTPKLESIAIADVSMSSTSDKKINFKVSLDIGAEGRVA